MVDSPVHGNYLRSDSRNGSNGTLTTTAVQLITVGPNRADSSIILGFHVVFIGIGLIGTVGNGSVIYILHAAQQLRKRLLNVMSINQMALDMFACFWLVASYALKSANVYLTGLTGYWACLLLVNETLIYCGLIGSQVNLAVIATERCVKIAHPFWYKKHIRLWMTYVVVAFTWTASTVFNFAVALPTTTVIDGVCYAYVGVESPEDRYGLAVYYGLTFFLLLFVFGACYGRIFFTVRRQAKMFPAHHASTAAARASNVTNTRIQMNAIKAMLYVTISFVILWCPFYVYNSAGVLTSNVTYDSTVYYAVFLVSNLNVVVNPFIYVAKYDVVRQRVACLLHCHGKNTVTVDTESTN